MRKFMINVNGSSYEVEVEEIRDGSVVTQPVPAAPVAAPKMCISDSRQEIWDSFVCHG